MNDCELDIGSGEVIQQSTDVFLSLAVPVELTRRYVSSARQQGNLGWAWLDNFERTARTSPEGLTKIDPLDGDVFLPWDICDGVTGPAVGVFHDSKAIPRALRPLSKPEILSQLDRAGGDALLVVEDADANRDVYIASPADANTWLLVERSDRFDNWLSYQYDGDVLVSITTVEGHQVYFRRSRGRVQQIAVTEGTAAKTLLVVEYAYDADDNLAWCRDAYGCVWEYEYADHLLVRVRGPHGYLRHFAYDEQRTCVASWFDQATRVRFLERDDAGRVLVTDSYGLATLLTFNEAGTMIQHVDARGQVTEVLVDGNNHLLGTVRPNGAITGSTVLDPTGTTLLENDGGSVWVRKFDDRGRLVSVVSPSGLTERREYGTEGELHRLVTWNGASFEYGYDERGNLARLADPLGYEIVREESDDRRRVRVLDAYGVLYEQAFDPLGNLLSEQDAGGRITSYTYSNVDSLRTETGPLGARSRYEYDDAQNLTAIVDPLGRVRRFESDPRRHLLAEIDPLGGRVEFVYDREDYLREIRNERGERYELIRDELYREIGARQFDGRLLTFELDEVGRRIAITDARGNRQQIDYAEGGAPVRRLFADGAVEDYSYSPEGECVGVSLTAPPGSDLPGHTATYLFDPTNRLTRDEFDGSFVEYTRNLAGQLVEVRDSTGGHTVYDLDGRYNVTRITEGGQSIEMTHLAAGEIAEMRFANGLTHRFRYDGAGRMIERTTTGPTGEVLTARRYEYDTADQLVAMTDSYWGAFRYSYDLGGRLTQVTDGDGRVLESYSYDATGNLTSTPLYNRVTYEPGNRISTADDVRFEFDADGNLVRRVEGASDWGFTWDRDDHLASVSRNGVEVAAYEYDFTSRRTRKTTADGTSRFVHDAYALRAETAPDGGVRHYVSLRELPVPIASWGEGGWQYYSYDHLGTPYEVFDEAGALIATFHPHAYGAERRVFSPTGAVVSLPFGFMGQYRDAESGLFCNHFRYYDPTLGRYISVDPLGVLAGMNFFAYPQNPNSDGDILGLMPVFECLAKWTPCQKAYARAKIRAVNAAPKTRREKTCTRCRANAQRRDFKSKRCGGGKTGKIARGRAIDHMHELQAGGADRCCANLRAVPKKYNGELGTQTNKMLKGMKVGATIMNITTKGCNGGPCSAEEMNKLATPPADTSVPCTEPPIADTC